MLGIMMAFAIINLRGSAQNVPGSDDDNDVRTTIKVQVYPNPSDGQFRLETYFEGDRKPSVRIYDLTGKLVEDISDHQVSL